MLSFDCDCKRTQATIVSIGRQRHDGDTWIDLTSTFKFDGTELQGSVISVMPMNVWSHKTAIIPNMQKINLSKSSVFRTDKGPPSNLRSHGSQPNAVKLGTRKGVNDGTGAEVYDISENVPVKETLLRTKESEGCVKIC